MKTTKRTWRHGRLGKVYKNINTLEVEHSLLNSPVTKTRRGFHFRSSDLPDKPHSKDSGSLCREIANTLL